MNNKSFTYNNITGRISLKLFSNLPFPYYLYFPITLFPLLPYFPISLITIFPYYPITLIPIFPYFPYYHISLLPPTLLPGYIRYVKNQKKGTSVNGELLGIKGIGEIRGIGGIVFLGK
jgi:hypothetical protein